MMEPNKPIKPTCSTCPYFVVGPCSQRAWDEGERFYIQGACRRRAPDAMAGFVQVSGQDWCGEHPQFLSYLEASREPIPKPNPEFTEGSRWITNGGWEAEIMNEWSEDSHLWALHHLANRTERIPHGEEGTAVGQSSLYNLKACLPKGWTVEGKPTLQLTKEDEGSWWLTRGGWKAQVRAVYETLSQVHPVMLSEVQHWVPGEGDKYAYHKADGKLYCERKGDSPYDLTERTNSR